MRNLNIDISELFLPVTPKLTRQEKSDLNAELVQLKQWEKFNQLTGFTSDIADEVEDRICEIKAILEKDEEEFYSEFEHTPITL